MSARQPRHPVECQGHVVVREAVWDSVSGNHQGQQPCALRKQAGHTTASDRRSYQLKKCLAMQEPSTQDIRASRSTLSAYASISERSGLSLRLRQGALLENLPIKKGIFCTRYMTLGIGSQLRTR